MGAIPNVLILSDQIRTVGTVRDDRMTGGARPHVIARRRITAASNARRSGRIAPPPPCPPEEVVTLTVTDLDVLPPAPVQVNVNVAVAVSAEEVALPLAGSEVFE